MEIDFWLVFGLLAQFVLGMRFIVQWVVSEKKKESYIPLSFWYLSVVGAIGLLIYAIHRRDIVFILGLSGGSLIYIRNLILIYKKKNNKGISG